MKDARGSAAAGRYCRAMGWARFAGASRPIVPLLAIRYLAIAILCLIALIGLVEWRLAPLARQGQVASADWESENAAIRRMNYYEKVKTAESDPVWRSAGIPAPGVKNGKRRVLVIGDSFAWGDGCANANDIWWRQLDRELRRRGYAGVEVVAAGLNGASTQDQLHWLRDLQLLERLDPDVVVLGYVTNDPDTRDAQGRHYVRQVGRDARSPSYNVLDWTLRPIAPHLTQQLKQQLTRKWESRLVDIYPYEQWELKLLEPPNIDAYRQVVAELGEFFRQSRVPVFAVTLPNAPKERGFRKRYRPIAPIFAGTGLPFHDVLDDFVAAFPGGGEGLQWGVNPVNGHPGRVSTRFYAREVADLLERKYPDRLGPKTAPQRLEPSINDWMPPAANVRRLGPGEWELSYPAPGAPALRLPIGKPYVLLAFAEPVAIRRVAVAGAGLGEAELYLGPIDPLTGVEPAEPVALGARSGPVEAWDLTGVAGAEQVNTLRLAARFAGATADASDRVLKLRIEFAEPAARP